MLRFLGFLTGSALTAALALAIVDPVTLESLRRSAATLFLGSDPAAPAVTPTAQPALGDDVGKTSVPPMGDLGAVPSRLLAALPGGSRPTGDAAVAEPAIRPDAAAGRWTTDSGMADADQSASAGGAADRNPVADRTAAASAAGPADVSARVAGLAAGPAERSGGDPRSGADPAAAGASPAKSSLRDREADKADSADPDYGSFDAGPARAADLAARPFDSGSPAVADDNTAADGHAPAQPGSDAAPQTPASEAPAPAESVPENSPAGAAADIAGADLGDLPPPSGAGDAGGWHAFWTPFRSEASASGFASHLERATGESYQVVRTGPGAYRVAFWHEGDDERSRRLLAIEQASGLRLRGGTL
jgi:hypothetical protein